MRLLANVRFKRDPFVEALWKVDECAAGLAGGDQERLSKEVCKAVEARDAVTCFETDWSEHVAARLAAKSPAAPVIDGKAAVAKALELPINLMSST